MQEVIGRLADGVLPGWELSLGALAVAVLWDLVLPEPPLRLHPVARFGWMTAMLEKFLLAGGPTRQLAGGITTVVIVIVLAVAFSATAVTLLLWLHPLAYIIGGGAILKTTFAVRGLEKAANETADHLSGGDLHAARTSLRNLVSRDPNGLSSGNVAAAAVESVAENTTDSYIAPWLYFAIGGVPGAFAYRAVNTIDSMIGYRGRYELFGKAGARLDDALSFIPARISALFIVIAGTITSRSPGTIIASIARDRRLTASPNAGWTMAAISGLLKVRLEKEGHYVLGPQFDSPDAEDVRATVRVARIVAVLGIGSTAGLVVALGILI